MKNLTLWVFAFIIFAAISHSAYAQNSILAGKITDEYNQPVCGASIKVIKDRKQIETRSDKDGLYYTPLLSSGYYYVGIYTKQRHYKT